MTRLPWAVVTVVVLAVQARPLVSIRVLLSQDIVVPSPPFCSEYGDYGKYEKYGKHEKYAK